MRRSQQFKPFGSGSLRGQQPRTFIRRSTESSFNNDSGGYGNHRSQQAQFVSRRNMEISFNDVQSLPSPSNFFSQVLVKHDPMTTSVGMFESKRRVLVNNTGVERLPTQPIPGLLDMNITVPSNLNQLSFANPQASIQSSNSRSQQSVQRPVQLSRTQSQHERNIMTKRANSFSPRIETSRSSSAETSPHGEKAKFRCQICRKQFVLMEEFDDHMASSEHSHNMNLVTSVYHSTNQKLLSTANNQMKKESRLNSANTEPRYENVCDVCDHSYGDTSEESHLASREHKHREHLIRKGCKLCGINQFVNWVHYSQHIKTVSHKRKRAVQVNAQKNKNGNQMKQPSNVKKSKMEDSSSASEDIQAKKIKVEVQSPQPPKQPVDNVIKVQVQSPLPPKQPVVDKAKVEAQSPLPPKQPVFAVEKPEVGEKLTPEMLEKLVFDPDTAIGTAAVITVTGFFCKVCHKFYNNETAAKVNHCKTKAHFDNYHKSLQKKLELEQQKVEECRQQTVKSEVSSESKEAATVLEANKEHETKASPVISIKASPAMSAKASPLMSAPRSRGPFRGSFRGSFRGRR